MRPERYDTVVGLQEAPGVLFETDFGPHHVCESASLQVSGLVGSGRGSFG